MKIKQAERSIKALTFGTVVGSKDAEALDIARQALELMDHIKDRPCEVCEFHDEEGCHKWTCVFDAWLHAYGSRRDLVGKEQNDTTDH